MDVHREWAPLGADRFYNLNRAHFYEGATFFRVLPGFVVQFGINPAAAVSKAWKEAKLKDDPVRETNRRGTLSFATDGPDTRTTQVFINLADNKRLDARGFSPFGEVTSGMDVVEKLYSGYGEGKPRGDGPDQDRMETEGALYTKTEFPKLDYVLKTRLR